MKKLLILSSIIFATLSSLAQTRSDYDAATKDLKHYYNQLLTDSIYYMMAPRMKTLAPQDKMEAQFKQTYQQLGEIQSINFIKEEKGIYYYKAVLQNATLSLLLVLNKDNKAETLRFLPYKPETKDTVLKEVSNIFSNTATGRICGTLTMPDGVSKPPVVLLIAGSGPTDRAGNNNIGLNTNSYKMIADSLQKAGIACVRYDKRGVGESMGVLKNEADLRFEDMISDAQGLVKMLKQDPRFSKVIVMGHSEGSLIGMIVAAREKTAGYISVSGIAERIDVIVEKQFTANSPVLGEESKIIMDSLVKGYIVKNVDSDLMVLFHPSVQPFLISWLKYDPRLEIKKLKMPVLILQGTHDIQVEADEAEKLHKACPRSTLKIIDGMSHILKQGPENRADNYATYAEPELPLSPGLMPAIIKFVDSLTKSK